MRITHVFPMQDTPTETMTLWLKCSHSCEYVLFATCASIKSISLRVYWGSDCKCLLIHKPSTAYRNCNSVTEMFPFTNESSGKYIVFATGASINSIIWQFTAVVTVNVFSSVKQVLRTFLSETVTLWLKCSHSWMSWLASTSCQHNSIIWEFSGVATVNVFSSVNQTLQTLLSEGNLARVCWHLCCRFTSQSASSFCVTTHLNTFKCKSFLMMCTKDEQETPVSRCISRGLLWMLEASSWLHVMSWTIEMLSTVLIDLGWPLPDFHSVDP